MKIFINYQKPTARLGRYQTGYILVAAGIVLILTSCFANLPSGLSWQAQDTQAFKEIHRDFVFVVVSRKVYYAPYWIVHVRIWVLGLFVFLVGLMKLLRERACGESEGGTNPIKGDQTYEKRKRG
jgi:hypothetical protein